MIVSVQESWRGLGHRETLIRIQENGLFAVLMGEASVGQSTIDAAISASKSVNGIFEAGTIYAQVVDEKDAWVGEAFNAYGVTTIAELESVNRIIYNDWDESGQSSFDPITLPKAAILLNSFAARNHGKKVTVEVNGQILADKVFDYDSQIANLVEEQLNALFINYTPNDRVVVWNEIEGMEFYL